MTKKIKFLLTLSMVLVLALASCAKNNPSSPGSGGPTSVPWNEHPSFSTLKGTWADYYRQEKYQITDKNVIVFVNNNVQYSSRKIIEIAWNEDGKSGIIYSQYVSAASPENNGRYTALAFRNLTSAIMEIVKCTKQISPGQWDETASSLKEAKDKFTEDNGYIPWDGIEYAKE